MDGGLVTDSLVYRHDPAASPDGLRGSEEIALTGEQVGSFPKAFTHLSLIDAAITLDRKLDEKATGRMVRTG